MGKMEKRGKEVPKILIVDDIGMNVEIMQNIIVAEGYEALGAMSVQEAIDIMTETMPTLILSDLSMPDVDGLQFCRMVKSDPKTRDIPFIFISVMDTTEEKEQAFLAGAVDYIPKPFERVEVVMRVNNQLNAYRLKQEMEHYNRMMHKLVAEQKKQIEREQAQVPFAITQVLERLDGDAGRCRENMGYNCQLLAQSLQFLSQYENEITDEFIETIETAARLYDIGRVLKAGGSPELERGEDDVRSCIEEGVSLLKEVNERQKDSPFLSMAMDIIRYYHANWDGTGFPEAAGREIPIAARIARVANDFTSLVGSSQDRTAEMVKAAVEKLNDGRGSLYEPGIVDALQKVQRQIHL